MVRPAALHPVPRAVAVPPGVADQLGVRAQCPAADV